MSRKKCKQIEKYLKECVFPVFPKEKMISMIENDFHTPGMIYDLLIRDYNFDKEFSPTQFRSFIQRFVKYDRLTWSKQKQSFKMQYRYPASFSVLDIEKDIIEQTRNAQKLTIEKRKQNGTLGNPLFKKTDSPLCIEFYTSRGFNVEFAKQKMLEIQLAGAIANQKTNHSGFEKKVQSIIEELNIHYVHQYKIRLLPEEKVFNKREYIYDFFLPDFNLLIECNGMYWHASPEIYKFDDIIKLPRFGEVKVQHVWDIDSHKEMVARKRNFKFETIWENKLLKTKETILAYYSNS